MFKMRMGMDGWMGGCPVVGELYSFANAGCFSDGTINSAQARPCN